MRYTTVTKMIMKEIKAHNKESEFLNEYNKCIKFESIGRYNKEGYEETVVCSDGTLLTRYEVKCRFKPADKYENNIVKYMINMYSNGEIGIYFDGTEYVA